MGERLANKLGNKLGDKEGNKQGDKRTPSNKGKKEGRQTGETTEAKPQGGHTMQQRERKKMKKVNVDSLETHEPRTIQKDNVALQTVILSNHLQTCVKLSQLLTLW